MCFVPADAFLDAALREDPDLLEHAFARDVVLATPSTLIAVLRTIAYTWRQEALAENAAAIHELGRELYRRISTMGAHVDKLGRSLSASVTAYNEAVGSLERRVVSTARRMSELGVVAPGTPLSAPEPLLDSVAASAQLGRTRRAAPRPAAPRRARPCVSAAGPCAPAPPPAHRETPEPGPPNGPADGVNKLRLGNIPCFPAEGGSVADASWAPGSGRDDGWGPSTSVRSASAVPAPGDAAPPRAPVGSRDHAPSRGSRASRSAGRARPADGGWESGPPRGRPTPTVAERMRAATNTAPQSGLRAWAALLVLVAIMVLGIVVDSLRGEQLSTGFDLGIILGSAVAILTVRRSAMFWVVVSPPIVYSLGAGVSLYLRSGGLHDRGVLIDAATNWLVYGFPAIAAASATVLIVAGVRLILRKWSPAWGWGGGGGGGWGKGVSEVGRGDGEEGGRGREAGVRAGGRERGGRRGAGRAGAGRAGAPATGSGGAREGAVTARARPQ